MMTEKEARHIALADAAGRRGDRIAALIVGGLALLLLITTFDARYFTLNDPDEARTVLVPRVLLIALTGFAALLFCQSFLARRRPATNDSVDWANATGWRRVLSSLGVIVSVALILKPAGFLLSMAFGIVALGVVMGFRRWLVLLAVGVAAPAIAWYLIVEVAELNLPRGEVQSAIGLG